MYILYRYIHEYIYLYKIKKGNIYKENEMLELRPRFIKIGSFLNPDRFKNFR